VMPLHFIHIGKCGGMTIRKEISKSKKWTISDLTHLKPAKYVQDSVRGNYLIAIRDPIDRFISAFNWAVKHNEKHPNDYGDAEIVSKYKTPNALAEKLYTEDGELDEAVVAEAKKIHHIGEDINFYLEAFLKVCPRESIVGVIHLEAIEKDMAAVLGIKITMHTHKNKDMDTDLSASGRQNLQKFLHKDYECVAKLEELVKGKK